MTTAGRPAEDPVRRERVRAAVAGDRTIEIATTGARTGRLRTTEIWSTRIGGRTLICGTPHVDERDGHVIGRDWLANIVAHPEITYRLVSTLRLDIPARAAPVTDEHDRRAIAGAPETAWYRQHSDGIEALVAHSPIVEITFLEPYAWLNG